MVSDVAVYRAPLRSRRDDVDRWAGVERGLRLGLCGFGDPRHTEPKTARRIERFADVAIGSFVWTLDAVGFYWLGRIDGPYFYDADGAAVDLVHVRRCTWVDKPLPEHAVPPAVVATFGRGGRNFQQIHDAGLGRRTAGIWVTATPQAE